MKKFMRAALKEAKKAYLNNEIPVGCVIVHEGKIIARAHNRRVEKELTHAHAEMLAIEKANKKLGSWRLENCDIYVTLEPCTMCAGAIIQARMRKVSYALEDVKSGALGGNFDLCKQTFNHAVIVERGLFESESKELIQAFFRNLRNNTAP